MATKRRKTKSHRRKSRKSCKYGKLKRRVKTKSGRKRRCKKKRKTKSKRRRKRKYKMKSLRELADMPNEIFANIFENSSLDDLIKLYKINNKSLREQVKKVMKLQLVKQLFESTPPKTLEFLFCIKSRHQSNLLTQIFLCQLYIFLIFQPFKDL